MGFERTHHDFDDFEVRETKVDQAIRVLRRARLTTEQLEAIDIVRIYGHRSVQGHIPVFSGLMLLHQEARQRKMTARIKRERFSGDLAEVRRITAVYPISRSTG